MYFFHLDVEKDGKESADFLALLFQKKKILILLDGMQLSIFSKIQNIKLIYSLPVFSQNLLLIYSNLFQIAVIFPFFRFFL